MALDLEEGYRFGVRFELGPGVEPRLVMAQPPLGRGAAPNAAPVLAWALPREVAEALNREYGAAFVGRCATSLQVAMEVDRSRQWRAISQHTSQAAELPLVARRLEPLGDLEHLRWLLAPDAG